MPSFFVQCHYLHPSVASILGASPAQTKEENTAAVRLILSERVGVDEIAN